MTRRGFLLRLSGGVALAALSPVARFFAPSVPVLWGDGKHDDTVALNAWAAGRPVRRPDGSDVGKVLHGGRFLVSDTIYFTRTDEGCQFTNNYIQTTEEFTRRMMTPSRPWEPS